MDAREARLLTSVQDALTSGKFGYVTWTWWGPKSDTFVYQGVDKVINGNLQPEGLLLPAGRNLPAGAEGRQCACDSRTPPQKV